MDRDEHRLDFSSSSSSSDDDFLLKLSETNPNCDYNYPDSNPKKSFKGEKSDDLELSEWHNYTLESDDEFSTELNKNHVKKNCVPSNSDLSDTKSGEHAGDLHRNDDDDSKEEDSDDLIGEEEVDMDVSDSNNEMWDSASEESVEYEYQNPNNEMLEENNNDPNNNMEIELQTGAGQMEPGGQRQNEEEESRKIKEENTWKVNRKKNSEENLLSQKKKLPSANSVLSVSPQPQAGCSKHFDSIESIFIKNSGSIHNNDEKTKNYSPEIREQANEILNLIKKLTFESICEGLDDFNWNLRKLLTEDLKKLLPRDCKGKKRQHESCENFKGQNKKLNNKVMGENVGPESPDVVVLPRVLKDKKIGDTIYITSSDEESSNKKLSHKAERNAMDSGRKSPEVGRKNQPNPTLDMVKPPAKLHHKALTVAPIPQDMSNLSKKSKKETSELPKKIQASSEKSSKVKSEQEPSNPQTSRNQGAIPKVAHQPRDYYALPPLAFRHQLHQQLTERHYPPVGPDPNFQIKKNPLKINDRVSERPAPIPSIRHQLHQQNKLADETIPPTLVENILDLQDEAASLPRKNSQKCCQEIYVKLRAMFPNIKSSYIQRFCPEDWSLQGTHETQLAQIIDNLLSSEPHWEYEEAPMEIKNDPSDFSSVDDIYQQLIEIFPNAEPGFMRRIAETHYQKDDELKQYIDRNIQNPTYTTREQFMEKLKVTEEQKKYTINFDINHFLDIFPTPKHHFEDAKRVCKFDATALECLKAVFKKIKVQTINRLYKSCGYNMSLAARQLTQLGSDMKTTRNSPEYPSEHIPLLQEMAYVKHLKEIENHLEAKKQREIDEFNKLKARNELLECQCCYDSEVLPSQCSTCDQGHIFCNSCILTGSGTKIGDGETHIPCFLGCGSEFNLTTLQKILQPTKFSILLKKRQAAEVMAADLDGLVSCPFCHFATIPAEGDKIFKCLNPECMKESCIECKEPNHVPLRCNEVGKADKTRKYIEEKMTEALSRVCNRCKKTFIKEEGCNKITCMCGAKMCYLCDKEIQDYNHFRGQGSNDLKKCPLYSDNTLLNYQTVKQVAEEVKKQLLAKDPTLIIDIESMLPSKPTPKAGPHETIAGDPNLATIHAARVLGNHK